MGRALTYLSGKAGNPYPEPELPLSTRTFHLAGAEVLARTITKYLDHHRESKDKFIQMQMFWEKEPESFELQVGPPSSPLGVFAPQAGTPSFSLQPLCLIETKLTDIILLRQLPCLADTKHLSLTLSSTKVKTPDHS